jgi:hypothetical protein
MPVQLVCHLTYNGDVAAPRSSLPTSAAADAHARQLKRFGLYAERLSRRDSMKVAQHEVLGNDAKKTRPSREER